MKTTRANLSAVVLIAAVISLTGLPALASQTQPACATQHHDCGTATQIAHCCCHNQGDGSTQGGPVEAKVQVNPNLTVALAVFAPIDCSHPHGTIARPLTSPPRANPLDLPTLFASLLI